MKVAQSRHIEAFDYDQGSRRLTIQFTNGSVYTYAGVDANTYYAFSQSSSPGSYFHSKIKGNYNTTLIAKGDSKKK
jgi:hypothetical protein